MLAPCLSAWTSIGKLLALKSCASRTLSRSSASSTVIFFRYMDENSSGSFGATFALVWTGAGVGAGEKEEGESCTSVMDTSPFSVMSYTLMSLCSLHPTIQLSYNFRDSIGLLALLWRIALTLR